MTKTVFGETKTYASHSLRKVTETKTKPKQIEKKGIKIK